MSGWNGRRLCYSENNKKMLVIGQKILFSCQWTNSNESFYTCFIHNHTSQLLFGTVRCKHNHWNRITCSNLIKDEVHENYESDQDLWLFNMRAFISTESL